MMGRLCGVVSDESARELCEGFEAFRLPTMPSASKSSNKISRVCEWYPPLGVILMLIGIEATRERICAHLEASGGLPNARPYLDPLQTALMQVDPLGTPTSTESFVGSVLSALPEEAILLMPLQQFMSTFEQIYVPGSGALYHASKPQTEKLAC